MKKQKVCHLLLFVSILFVFVFVGCDPNPDSTKTPSSNEDNQTPDPAPTSGGASFPEDFRGTWMGVASVDTEEVDEEENPIFVEITFIVDIQEKTVEARTYMFTDHESADQYDLVEYTSTSFKLKNTASVDENGKWGAPEETELVVISHNFTGDTTAQVNFSVGSEIFPMKKIEFSQPDFLKQKWVSQDYGEITLTDEYEFEVSGEDWAMSCSGTWDASYTYNDGKYSGILRTVTTYIDENDEVQTNLSFGGASPYEYNTSTKILIIGYPNDDDNPTGIFDVAFGIGEAPTPSSIPD